MTKFYWIRHCEAVGNVQRLLQGHVDLDISPLGEIQLSFLAKRFENETVDAVYSSPLIRAVKTARAVADPKGLEVITDQGLIELNGGIFDGKPRDESFRQYPEIARNWNHHPEDFQAPEGEPMRSVYDRAWEAVVRIAKDNKDKTVVIATHGGVTRCLACRLIYGDIKKLSEVNWAENTSVSCFELDDRLNHSLLYYNDCSHLPEQYINPKSRFVKLEEPV